MVSVFSFYTFRTMRAWQLVFELNILLELQEHNDYCLKLFEPWLHVISILICLYSCQNNESKCGHQFLEFFLLLEPWECSGLWFEISVLLELWENYGQYIKFILLQNQSLGKMVVSFLICFNYHQNRACAVNAYSCLCCC